MAFLRNINFWNSLIPIRSPWLTQCNGVSVNAQTDPKNCGSCGRNCGDDGSGFITDDDLTFCNAGLCASHAHCPPSVGGGYRTSCGTDCQRGRCKTMRCRDLAADTANCGTCGHACNPGEMCCSGNCIKCKPGEVCCAGACANLTSDPTNCGSCGTVCRVANGAGGCMNGSCVISMCTPGFANCNGVYGDGCEVNLNTDPNNCGSCGKPCVGGKICLGGTCVCPQPLTDCNGVCTDIHGFDANNCGTCFGRCLSTQSCCNGVCKDLSSDPQTCGNCTTRCDQSCSGARLPCIEKKCEKAVPFVCWTKDANTQCLNSASITVNATTVAEATSCATLQSPNAPATCGMQPAMFSFAVWAPPDGVVSNPWDMNGDTDPVPCPKGTCENTVTVKALNATDALACAKARFAMSGEIIDPKYTSCSGTDCYPG